MNKHIKFGVLASLVAMSLTVGCEQARQEDTPGGDTDSAGTATDGLTTGPTTAADTGENSTGEEKIDIGNDTSDGPPGCAGDGTCNAVSYGVGLLL